MDILFEFLFKHRGAQPIQLPVHMHVLTAVCARVLEQERGPRAALDHLALANALANALGPRPRLCTAALGSSLPTATRRPHRRRHPLRPAATCQPRPSAGNTTPNDGMSRRDHCLIGDLSFRLPLHEPLQRPHMSGASSHVAAV